MNISLYEFTVNGCKNINKQLSFKFGNQTLNRSPKNTTNIKAIYGANGSGKSAIITAMYIYQHLVLFDGVNNPYFAQFLNETINNKLNSFDFSITIKCNYKSSKDLVFKHEIKLEKIDDNLIKITNEKLSKLKGNSIKNENFFPIVNIENGNIIYLDGENNISDTNLYKISTNLIDKVSIVSLIIKYIRHNPTEDIDNYLLPLVCHYLFADDILVELEDEDKHTRYVYNKVNTSIDYKSIIDNLINSSKEQGLFSLSISQRDKVLVKNIANYEKNIEDLKAFLKIFKPNLKSIEVDKKINDEYYYCDKVLVYDDYKINVEFESTGIKKLIRLFSYLKACANGKIVFIDEMDANLHDVYFAKLIEFFKNNGKGLLFFTTHNLSPIEILQDKSFALEFISNDSQKVSWIKNGHSSPLKKYKNGLIEYSPFNVETFDFEILIEED